jgi:hypothetical protein
MQRALAYALSPAPGLPLRFLLAAPWFGVLAALLLLAAGENTFVSRWSAPALGATHLLTLGYLGMAMAGSILQLIPVVTGAALAFSRIAAAIAWHALALGALLLASALALNAVFLFMPAALLLAGAFALLVAALLRPASAAAMPMVRGMRLAVAGLVITVGLGVVLAFALGGVLAAPVIMLANLHAAWGLLGWVTMLVVGVAFQVIPMFQSSQVYPALVTRWGPWVLFGLLAAWTSGATLAAATLLGLASALLYLLPEHPQAPLAIGIVFIAGFAMGTVNGMLYKIVPFLLWYHLQHDPAAKKGDVPSIRLILPDALARRQFWWHAAALSVLVGAVYWPAWLARPAAILLAVASLLLALDLWRAAASCRAIRRRLQPS